MSQTPNSPIVMYQSIEMWTRRPGTIAVATTESDLVDGAVEVDIKTKEEAIAITEGILRRLLIWEVGTTRLLKETSELVVFEELQTKYGPGFKDAPLEERVAMDNLRVSDVCRSVLHKQFARLLVSIEGNIAYYRVLLQGFKNL